MAVKPIPDGFHSVTPYLIVEGAAKFIDFVKQAFDATEVVRMPGPDGRVMHAEVRIGDSIVMLADTSEQYKATTSAIYLYVNDADATYKRALTAGATSVMEPADQFYGDRNGGVRDAFGNMWWIATHKEDVAPHEMAMRTQAILKSRHA